MAARTNCNQKAANGVLSPLDVAVNVYVAIYVYVLIDVGVTVDVGVVVHVGVTALVVVAVLALVDAGSGAAPWSAAATHTTTTATSALSKECHSRGEDGDGEYGEDLS